MENVKIVSETEEPVEFEEVQEQANTAVEKPTKPKKPRKNPNANRVYTDEWKEKMRKVLATARAKKQTKTAQKKSKIPMATYQVPDFTGYQEDTEEEPDDEPEEDDDTSYVISPLSNTLPYAPPKLKRQKAMYKPRANTSQSPMPNNDDSLKNTLEQLLYQQSQMLAIQQRNLTKPKAPKPTRTNKPPININVMPPTPTPAPTVTAPKVQPAKKGYLTPSEIDRVLSEINGSNKL